MDLIPTFLHIAEAPAPTEEFQGRQVLPVRGRSFWDLFNLQDDPGERQDVSDLHPDIKSALVAHWADYADRIGLEPWRTDLDPFTPPEIAATGARSCS